MKSVFMALCVFSLFVGCKKEEKKQKQEIDNYVASHNLKGQFTSSGLFFTVDVEGTGGNPSSSSTVKVEYTGTLLNGNKFDGTEAGKPISFSLNEVIEGWQEGIPKFQKGGKGKLIIPSRLAYGSTAQSGIPANSVLVFDVYLVDWN